MKVIGGLVKSFQEVNQGEMFWYDDNFYLKTEIIYGTDFNCVDLVTGELAYFFDEDEVVPKQAEVIIK